MQDYRLDEIERPERHPAAIDRLIGPRGRSGVELFRRRAARPQGRSQTLAAVMPRRLRRRRMRRTTPQAKTAGATMPPTMTADQKKTSLTSIEAKLRPVRQVHSHNEKGPHRTCRAGRGVLQEYGAVSLSRRANRFGFASGTSRYSGGANCRQQPWRKCRHTTCLAGVLPLSLIGGLPQYVVFGPR